MSVWTISQYRSKIWFEESTDVDSVEAFVGVVELLAINRLYGFDHMFYANALKVLVVLPVLLVFYCFGAYALMVRCNCAGMNIGVRGWLLVRRIVWYAVP